MNDELNTNQNPEFSAYEPENAISDKLFNDLQVLIEQEINVKLFPDFEIVVPLARQLSWSRFLAIIPLESESARMSYAQAACESSWSNNQRSIKREWRTC